MKQKKKQKRRRRRLSRKLYLLFFYAKNRKYVQQNKHCLFAAGLAAVVIICLCSLFFHKTVSSASTDGHFKKCYKSVEIQKGDSLWSLSKEYYTDDWENVAAFQKEIIEFNGIKNHTIHAGNYIAIPYYISDK